MIKHHCLTLFVFIAATISLSAQIKNVFVETYYIADSDDLTNTTGGPLSPDSKTYRIFVDLEQGSKILRLYGDKNHALIFSSTEPFYNNTEDGVSLAYEMNRARLKDNTVALDSWLTLGQVSKTGSGTLAGVPKDKDTNGSIIGGSNNDGGSAGILAGLLKNSETKLGIPLTISDGIMPLTTPPTMWLSQGFYDVLTSDELTIFGSSKVGNHFKSNDLFISNSGSSGVLENINTVLIGQITTAGEISFELNLQVLTTDGEIKKYVANDSILLNDETFIPLLKYPLVCGCLDPNFIEYSSGFACDDNSKCVHPIVFGCMDSLACNYNRKANFNISSLCCYVGYCNDIDLEIICPDLPLRDKGRNFKVQLYPNPATNHFTVDYDIHPVLKTTIQIIDMIGNVVMEQYLSDTGKESLPITSLPIGYYTVLISNSEATIRKKLIKINP